MLRITNSFPVTGRTSKSTFGTNSNPANSTNQSMGWAANPTRKVEGAFTVAIIQMGARVYLPSLGRFLQVDPVEGGTANSYVYVGDPVNANDYSGQFSLGDIVHAVRTVMARVTAVVARVAAVVRPAVAQPAAKPAVKTVAKTTTQIFQGQVVGGKPNLPTNANGTVDFRKLNYSFNTAHPVTPGADRRMDVISGLDAASDYYSAGTKIGLGVGCAVGAALTPEALGGGCVITAPVVAGVAGPIFGLWGFIEGAFDLSGAERFTTGQPDLPNGFE